jgi:murein DD-endopeptidase MepM/ murein hydrolase activator NlpD
MDERVYLRGSVRLKEVSCVPQTAQPRPHLTLLKPDNEPEVKRQRFGFFRMLPLYGYYAAVAVMAAVQFAARAVRHFTSLFVQPLRRVRGRTMVRARIRNRHERLNSIVLLGMASLLVAGFGFFDFGLEVQVNGQSIGFVANQSDFEDGIRRVNSRMSGMLNEPYHFNPSVSYHFSLVNRKEMLNREQLDQTLFGFIDNLGFLYTLSVDGSVIGASESRDVIDSAVQSLIIEQPGVDVGFASDVAVSRQWVDLSKVKSEDQLQELFAVPLRPAAYHTPSDPETLDSIARSYGMTADTLLSYNPDLDPDGFAEAAVIVVSPELPLISIETSQRITEEVVLSYETHQMEDGSMIQGQSSVVQAGADGLAMITYELRTLNGREQQRVVLSKEILLQPVDRVVTVGIREPPPKTPTGTYVRPFNGIMTSNYGWRRLRGRSEFHTGVDFAGPFGSRIVAIDGGTVTFAGWKGNYGNTVIISHGNGLESLYGHNSSITVKVGQRVGKGEQIARMGSTGRSTGNHVHLEIRRNGKHVNPWNFIK